MKRHRLLLGLLSTLAIGAAAQTAPSEFIPPAAPQVRESGGVAYLSGGAGDEERQAMLAQAARFPLRLVFSVPGGAYAVPDELTISGRQGVVFSVREAGPWLMLALPPGTYTARASFNGAVQQRSLKVSAGVQKINWIAPAPTL
jgi:hypothetical protein